jgi:hypothetical protein
MAPSIAGHDPTGSPADPGNLATSTAQNRNTKEIDEVFIFLIFHQQQF